MLSVLMVCASSAPVSALQVRLRNDLSPGSLVVYTVQVDATRTIKTPRYDEKLTYSQSGRLTLLVLQQDRKTRTAQRAWMMELDAADITGLARDDQPVDPLPDPKDAGAPPRTVQLITSEINSETAPSQPAGGSLVQRLAMMLALDFARWPDALVAPDQTWESDAGREELSGAWTHHYTGVEGERSDRLAVGTFSFDGAPAGPLAGTARIEKVSGTWKWRIAKRSLESSTSEVSLVYDHPEAPRRLDLRVMLAIKRRDRLRTEVVDKLRDDLATLSKINEQGATQTSAELSSALQGYVDSHADSLWLPVARDLLERSTYDETTFADLSPDKLRTALQQLITRWQTAALAGHTESLEPVRATFRTLADNNREAVHDLSRDSDRNMRAIAVFCVAFGSDAGDLQRVVELCADKEARVRMWAAYGLAERRDTDVESDVLTNLLTDEDAKVRYRACMAVSTCVSRESPRRESFMRELLARLARDDSEPVLEQAALAVDRLAVPADLPALIEAESKQDVPSARRLLEATIRRLGGEPRSDK